MDCELVIFVIFFQNPGNTKILSKTEHFLGNTSGRAVPNNANSFLRNH